MITVYVTIGNSDDKLTQSEWSDFITRIQHAFHNLAYHQHGEWFSNPDSKYQNAIWCIEVREVMIHRIKDQLSMIAKKFRQESIAWVEAKDVEFIRPE